MPKTSLKERIQQGLFLLDGAMETERIDDKAVYKVSPEDFAAVADKIHSTGVSIIGGCCGTGPDHIAAVAKKLKK